MGINPSKLSSSDSSQILADAELQLLIANTHFTAEQINKFHHDFLKDCPNGRLDKKDFVRLFKALHPSDAKQAKADSYCDYVFRAFDINGDGSIDFSEFVIAFSITSFGDLKEKAQFAFHIFDLDKNNSIDKSEMLRVVESLFDLNGVPQEERQGNNAPAKHVEFLFERLDKNNDTVLSLDEFVEGCLADEGVRKFLVDSIFK